MTVTLPTFDYVHDDVTYTAEHAVVTEFRLEREGHSIFTAHVVFAGEGWGSSLPGCYLENDKGGPFIAALVDRLGTPWRGIGVKTPVVVFTNPHRAVAGFAVVRGAALGEPFFVKDWI